MSRLNAALDAGGSVMFTRDGTGCTVTIAYGGMTFTGRAGNAAAALDRAMEELPEG